MKEGYLSIVYNLSFICSFFVVVFFLTNVILKQNDGEYHVNVKRLLFIIIYLLVGF